ncbi:MAG: AAA family ATPase [Oligoflexia bacterium]|nr:AAA family ATPase [Oligoflexia bacterium]
MKLAISGKGGVGKSTLAAALALLLARKQSDESSSSSSSSSSRVLAVDADPDSNLALSLGISEEKIQRQIPTIANEAAMIEERTGAKVKQYGQMFKLNPEVSDLLDKYAIVHQGVALLVLGGIESGGSGCACPENTLIRALVSDLILHKDETLIMDMAAGIEHLGRATARGVDVMLVVVEPGQRSIECAQRIIRMSKEIGIRKIKIVANKITSADDEKFIQNAFQDTFQDACIVGSIPYSLEIRDKDKNKKSILENLSSDLICRFEEILKRIKN